MNVYKQNDKAYFQLTYILRPRSFAEDIFVKIRLWSYPTAIYHGDSPYTLWPRDQTAFIASVWGFVIKIICTEKSRCESIFHGYYCRNANEVFASVLEPSKKQSTDKIVNEFLFILTRLRRPCRKQDHSVQWMFQRTLVYLQHVAISIFIFPIPFPLHFY